MHRGFVITLALVFLFAGTLSWGDSQPRYCVPVKGTDFNPFRKIDDGKELAYLTLLNSYISTDSSEPGILEKYEFSPDGMTLTGIVSDKVKWNDGASVTSEEAAFGIAYGLLFRPLGERIQVLGSKRINVQNAKARKFSGIQILSDKEFVLKFSSKIENSKGVLREALSTNSRHNRFWPIRLKGDLQVLGKFPISISKGMNVITVGNQQISIVDESQCKNADYSIFLDALESDTDKYTVIKSPAFSALYFQANTQRLSLKQREQLASWVRSAVQRFGPQFLVEPSNRFFVPGETGYLKDIEWKNSDTNILKGKKWTIAVEAPYFVQMLKLASKADGVSIKVIELPRKTSDFDAQVLVAGVIQGRQVILQDLLKWAHVANLSQGAPKTIKSLTQIAIQSASTIPPDQLTLQMFEKAAMDEWAFAPLGRRTPRAYSLKSSNPKLSFNSFGELTFKIVDN